MNDEMIISNTRRFAILAPWKTASSTLHLRLAPYNESPYSRFYDFNPHLQRVVHQHLTYADFAALPEGRAGHFTAAFVRNPYDRVYSGFLQLQSAIQKQPYARYPQPWIKTLVMHQLAANFAQLAAGEFEFNKWFGLVEERQIYEVGHNPTFPLHPAHYWTGINGEQKVDFVGKVEAFEADLLRLCDKIGIPAPECAENANVSVRPADPRFMTPASISKIETIFAKDFELFEYERR